MPNISDVLILISTAGAIVTLYYLVVDRGRVPSRGALPKITAAAFLVSILVHWAAQHYGTWLVWAFQLSMSSAWALSGLSFHIQHESPAAT